MLLGVILKEYIREKSIVLLQISWNFYTIIWISWAAHFGLWAGQNETKIIQSWFWYEEVGIIWVLFAPEFVTGEQCNWKPLEKPFKESPSINQLSSQLL